MATRQHKLIAKSIAVQLLILFFMPIVVFAAQSSSSNYQVNEVFFGSGGTLSTCSAGNYCSKQAAGEMTVGNAASPNYQAQGGFNTDRTPYIQVIVNNPSLDLGVLKPTTTATANATFSVKAYLAHGYNVVTASDPPRNNSYVMQSMTAPTASAVGAEQFGINLVANTSPVTFGANPTFNPDNTFSFGNVAASYSSPNLYKYVKGDTIAYSNSSSSATTYTISYIFNISNVTPGGQYVLNHVLVATGTY